MQDIARKRSFFLSTPFLVTAILLAPIVLMVFGGGQDAGVLATFGMVMFSGPILIGLMAQRLKGRTGVWWTLLAVVVAFLVNVLAGGGHDSKVLANTLLFGLIPMVVIVATLPRRKAE